MSCSQNDNNASLEDDTLELKALSSVHHGTDEELLREQLESFRQDRIERKSYAARVWKLICVYLIALGVLVMGSQWLFRLSDSVLIALLCTTTANILGLAYIVMRYLFKNK